MDSSQTWLACTTPAVRAVDHSCRHCNLHGWEGSCRAVIDGRHTSGAKGPIYGSWLALPSGQALQSCWLSHHACPWLPRPAVWFVSRPFVLAVACLLVLAPLLSLRDLGCAE